MRMLLTVPVLALIGSACASLPPAEERQVVAVEATKVSQSVAYNRALAYVAKTWNNSNYAIRVQDKEAGQIIVKGKVECRALKPALEYADTDYLSFALDFQAKDKKVRISFEDLVIEHQNGSVRSTIAGQITGPDKLQAVREKCLDPMRSEILAAVNGTARNAAGDW